jgi:cytochrome c553
LKIVLSLIFITLSLYGSDSDKKYREGENIYFSKGCNGCHGVDATGVQGYPRLANKPKYYLQQRLKMYKSGAIKRQKAFLMKPFAEVLNSREVEKVTYFLENIVQSEEELYYPDSGNWGDGGS